MAEEPGQDEDELALRQGGKVYPVGRALRATYDAENHDTLGRDVTGLMLHLSRVPYEPFRVDGEPPAPEEAEMPCARDVDEEPGLAKSLLGRVRSLWRHR